jgi:hypothetical protein
VILNFLNSIFRTIFYNFVIVFDNFAIMFAIIFSTVAISYF